MAMMMWGSSACAKRRNLNKICRRIRWNTAEFLGGTTEFSNADFLENDKRNVKFS